jgi:uncharacterized protein (DUF983 family)
VVGHGERPGGDGPALFVVVVVVVVVVVLLNGWVEGWAGDWSHVPIMERCRTELTSAASWQWRSVRSSDS